MLSGFVLFSTVYYVVPNRPQRWSQVWPGALLAAVLFECITLLFPLYLQLNRGIGAYGNTFGLLFVVLTFLYFFGLTTMLGVEVNSVLYPVPAALPESRQAVWGAAPSIEGRRRRPRRGVPALVAVGLALIASAVGILLGRRSAGGEDPN
jgi:hypothetical protein